MEKDNPVNCRANTRTRYFMVVCLREWASNRWNSIYQLVCLLVDFLLRNGGGTWARQRDDNGECAQGWSAWSPGSKRKSTLWQCCGDMMLRARGSNGDR